MHMWLKWPIFDRVHREESRTKMRRVIIRPALAVQGAEKEQKMLQNMLHEVEA